MKIRQILLASAAVLALAACRQEQEAEVSSVSFGTESVSVSAGGDIVSVALKANCEWTATAGVSWLEIAPASGSASTASINVKVGSNDTGADRTGVVTVKSTDGLASAELTVRQSGVIESDFDISTAEKFAAFLANAINATESDEYKILADIDMEGAVLTPAGSFAGTLDGNGHKIYNYKVESAGATSGLFLQVSGKVEDLVLGSKDGSKHDGTSTVGFADGVTATSHIGGVCASLSGTLDNVRNFATVVSPLGNAEGVAGIGGLVGAMYSPSTIKDCTNDAEIRLTGQTGNGIYVGGIVGHMNNKDALVEGCVNNATLEFALENSKYAMYGGIAGCALLGGTMKNCVNNAAVTLNQSGTTTAGTYIMIAGISGALYTGAKTISCTNKGDVSSNRMQVSRIGGIVGTLNSQGLVEGCVNDGNVTLEQAAPNDNWQAAGGIVGFEEKLSEGNIITGNTNNGAVTVKVENNTTHANKVAAGGILGTGVLGLEVTDNINNGAVSVINKAAGPAFAGGIAGWVRGEPNTLGGNVNKGTVSCSTSDNAAAYAGGVLGALTGAMSGTSFATCGAIVDGASNEGAVVCANPAGAGSVAGVNAGNLLGCIAGGSVNSVTLTDDNFAKLAVGTNTGKIEDLKSPSGGTAVVYELKADPAEITVDAEAVSASFQITSNTEWTVACSAEWIKSFTKSGKDNGKVEITFDANTSKDAAREAEFTVSAEKVDPVKVKLVQNKVPSIDGGVGTAAMFIQFLSDAALVGETTTIDITADIDMGGAVLEPAASFAGTLNGNNHKIFNYTVASKQATSGLILENKGTVKDLILGSKDGATYDGMSVVGFDASITAAGHIGGLCAVNSGTVQNVKQFATVRTPLGNTALVGIGGLVGYMATAGTVKDCENGANIDANKDGIIGGESYLAGVVAYINHADVVVDNCVNSAPISIKYVNAKASMFGGVVGRANAGAKITNCRNTAPVSYDEQKESGTSGNYLMLAGVVGALYTGASMSGCTNTGDVTSTHLQVSRLAGIVGTINSSCSVTNCTNSGKVTLRQAAPNNNWQSVGGVVGFQEKVAGDALNVVKGNTNNGEVVVEVENVTDNSHANKVNAGGIVGLGVLGLVITDNVNNADVTVTNKAAGICYAGGVVGRLYGKDSSLSGNVNKGKVSCATSDNANAFAGGVAGAFCSTNKLDASSGTASDAVSTEDKNLGAVVGAAPISGSLAGFNFGTINDGLAGGSVNGTALSAGNAATLAVGSSSKGTLSGVTFAAN